MTMYIFNTFRKNNVNIIGYSGFILKYDAIFLQYATFWGLN